ncbi:hypothetical protein L7F22_018094 [Adiantum nelumboides]|nr:hypothetical protein [Adiantum nelumboides]
MASLYYETLFTSDPLTQDVHDARDEVWSFVRPVVSEDMQIAIMRPFSLQEEGLQEIFDTGCMPLSMSSDSCSDDHCTIEALARYSSQTGFVQDRSILDNVVTFYEIVEWVRQMEQPIAIMLLDFEKAFDRVDWQFLEGTLSRMGFPHAWIRGISELYRSASAAVTIGGHVGRTFTLCPIKRPASPRVGIQPECTKWHSCAISCFRPSSLKRSQL